MRVRYDTKNFRFIVDVNDAFIVSKEPIEVSYSGRRYKIYSQLETTTVPVLSLTVPPEDTHFFEPPVVVIDIWLKVEVLHHPDLKLMGSTIKFSFCSDDDINSWKIIP